MVCHSIKMKRFFSIGQVKILLEFDAEHYEMWLDKALGAFAVDHFDTPDIRFLVDTVSSLPLHDAGRKIFTSNPKGLWTIFEDDTASNYVISLQNVEADKTPYRIIKADREFRNFIVYDGPGGHRLRHSLEYPLVEMAVSGHLSLNKVGIVLHSACISWKGKGYLFAGVSGSGKSTMSELWGKEGGEEVLSDERVIIREHNGDLWAFGTPWHGTSELHRNTGARIEKIFFIGHGKKNKAKTISKMDAANGLIVRCFPTFWNREGMEFSVDFCSRIAQQKECYDLEFVNDMSVLEYLRKRM